MIHAWRGWVFYSGGCVLIHIKDKTMERKEEALKEAAEIFISHCGGRMGRDNIIQEHADDAISLSVFGVACCYSNATGNGDLTVGIAGPKSKNKTKDRNVRAWRTRFFVRGVTARGWEDKTFNDALEVLVKEFGV